MPVYRLGREIVFPPAEHAEPSGLLAVGGDLSPARLLEAYERGIFPWYSEGDPILWHSPDPRGVLEPRALHVPRSLRKRMRRGTFEVRFDTAFAAVIAGCARARRPGQQGTWITGAMLEAYVALHALGFAHSAEAWDAEGLAGGVYGVALGGCFFAESMYAERSDASKVALVTLVRRLETWGFRLIDCQMQTEHTRRFGVVSWPRARFLRELAEALALPTRRGPWRLDAPRGQPPSEP